ncbi:MAG: proline iminopeptidase-family hydrolase [Candidatus Zixiibacteriota bacterium]
MLRSRRQTALWCVLLTFGVTSGVAALDRGEGYLNISGGKVWYRVDGDGSGVPLLVIHGGPGLPSDYLFSLSDQGKERPVIFYDQLGCGRSTRTTDPSQWTIDHFVAELDALRTHLGLDRVHLYGHSWGSIIAIEYMLTNPEGVESLVLAGPVFNFDQWSQDIDSLIGMFPDSIRAVISQTERDGTYQSAAFQQAVMDFYHSYLARQQPWSDDLVHALENRNRPMAEHMVGPSPFSITGTLSHYDCTDKLKLVTVPVLLLAGDHDEVLASTLVSYNKLLPNSRAAIVGRSGHLPSHDQPGKHNRIIKGFFREIEGPGTSAQNR